MIGGSLWRQHLLRVNMDLNLTLELRNGKTLHELSSLSSLAALFLNIAAG